jgi:putative endonuclease
VAGRCSIERGAAAEDLVARRLREAGWHVLGRNVRVGRLELDIVAVDPRPPGRLVAVEVRFRTSRRYGFAEETFDVGKRRRTLRALLALRATGALADGVPVPSLSPALDLIVVEPAGLAGSWRVRHHRDVLA